MSEAKKKYLYNIYIHPDKSKLVLRKYEITRETKTLYFMQPRDIPNKDAEKQTRKLSKTRVEPLFFCTDGFYHSIEETIIAWKNAQLQIIKIAEQKIKRADKELHWLIDLAPHLFE